MPLRPFFEDRADDKLAIIVDTQPAIVGHSAPGVGHRNLIGFIVGHEKRTSCIQKLCDGYGRGVSAGLESTRPKCAHHAAIPRKTSEIALQLKEGQNHVRNAANATHNRLWGDGASCSPFSVLQKILM